MDHVLRCWRLDSDGGHQLAQLLEQLVELAIGSREGGSERGGSAHSLGAVLARLGEPSPANYRGRALHAI